MKTYKIPVSWSVCAEMKIEATSLEEAITLAEFDEPLPTNTTYIAGTFEVNRDFIEHINRDPEIIEEAKNL